MKIVIYGKLMCQACENAKRELTKRGASYERQECTVCQ